MPALQEQHGAHDAPPPFRLDVQLHDLLKKSPKEVACTSANPGSRASG